MQTPGIAPKSHLAWIILASVAIALSLPAQTFSPWSNVENLGPLVNSADRESCQFVSDSGLSLYFASARPGGAGALDIYVSQRDSLQSEWGPATNLEIVNTPEADQLPFITPGGHTLIFASTRPSEGGGYNLYASFRRNAGDDFAWEAPIPMEDLNSTWHDFAAWGFTDPSSGRLVIYFSSDRPGGPGSFDTYVSTQLPNGRFSPPVLVAELSSNEVDYLPAVRKDGLELFLTSNRPGGLGGMDIWSSTRSSISEPWSAPVNLGLTINTSGNEERGATFGDSKDLYFFADRDGGEGGLDLYRAVRSPTTIIPVVGATRGARGSQFQTSAELSNPGDGEISGYLLFHPIGVEAGNSDPRYSYRLAPYESQLLPDLMASIGASGVGSLEIVPESGAAPATAFRISNGGGSFIVPPAGPDSVMSAGTHSAVKMPSNTEGFRTNVGVRTFTTGAEIWVCMHDADGTFIRGFTRNFAPDTVVQMPIYALLGGEVMADQMVMFTVNGGSAVIFVSTIDANGGSTLQIVRKVED